MTDNQRTEYTRIGLALLKICSNSKTSELLWRFQDLLYQKGGDVDLRDTAQLEAMVNKKYSKKKK